MRERSEGLKMCMTLVMRVYCISPSLHTHTHTHTPHTDTHMHTHTHTHIRHTQTHTCTHTHTDNLMNRLMDTLSHTSPQTTHPRFIHVTFLQTLDDYFKTDIHPWLYCRYHLASTNDIAIKKHFIMFLSSCMFFLCVSVQICTISNVCVNTIFRNIQLSTYHGCQKIMLCT